MADSMVPELEAFKTYAILSTVAKERQLTHDQVEQLGYDDFMQTLAYLNHSARWSHEFNAAQQITNRR